VGPLLFLVALASCAASDTAEAFVTSHGTVYACDTDQGCPGGDEYCWDGSQRELEQDLGTTCHTSDRLITLWGCAYCCGADCPRGANAHCGAFCPPELP
jgi:hypothetical protein